MTDYKYTEATPVDEPVSKKKSTSKSKSKSEPKPKPVVYPDSVPVDEPVKAMAKGGSFRSAANGIAQRGKTRGTMVMCGGGMARGKK